LPKWTVRLPREDGLFAGHLDMCEKMGLDVMSAGVAMAWATEAQKQGLISGKETGQIELNWGNWETYIKAALKAQSEGIMHFHKKHYPDA